MKNNVNGKTYIGKSWNLGGRFTNYYNNKFISIPRQKMLIYKALLKHGYTNFSLIILEYCEFKVCTEREQHYINLLRPDYNIFKTAGHRWVTNIQRKH
jgi:group I intron endonuclease